MTCFEDCIYYERCEHQNPNLCGVAAPCTCFPAGDIDNCPICGGKMRLLWFTAGFLLGVVTTTLGLLWMMALAVVG